MCNALMPDYYFLLVLSLYLSMLGRLPSSRCLELYRVLSRSICPGVGGGRSGRSDRLRWENSIDFTELAFLARKNYD